MWCPSPVVHHDEQYARSHERGGQDRGRAGQEIRGRAAGHKSRHPASAHAEGATLALLQQDDPDKGDRDQDVNGEEQNDHGPYLFTPQVADQSASHSVARGGKAVPIASSLVQLYAGAKSGEGLCVSGLANRLPAKKTCGF